MKKYFKFISSLIFILIMLPLFLQAAVPPCDPNSGDACFCEWSDQPGGLVPCGRHSDNPDTANCECCPCTLCHLFLMGKGILDFFLKIVIGIATIVIVIGAIMMMTAGGSETRVSKAKSWITWAIVGILVVLFAWLIVNFILTFFGDNTLFQNWNEIQCSVR